MILGELYLIWFGGVVVVLYYLKAWWVAKGLAISRIDRVGFGVLK